ncbi:MAG: hypothetical protein KAG28_03050 [Cocleimonas sp.]|nr:hypothetical protein [Cocleimonas sp.]
MNSQEVKLGSGSQAVMKSSLDFSLYPLDHLDPLKEKLLEHDKQKRQTALLIGGFFLALFFIIALVLLLKPNVIQDSTLVENIELLSSNDDVAFYTEVEFYHWLDSKPPEQ